MGCLRLITLHPEVFLQPRYPQGRGTPYRGTSLTRKRTYQGPYRKLCLGSEGRPPVGFAYRGTSEGVFTAQMPTRQCVRECFIETNMTTPHTRVPLHKNHPPPLVHHRSLGIGLLKVPTVGRGSYERGTPVTPPRGDVAFQCLNSLVCSTSCVTLDVA
jgi:hypothetical protein